MSESQSKPIAPVNGITLDQPITHGEQTITSITLRKPKVGDLRGISLVEVAQMDVDALAKLLPRIADPVITDIDVHGMDIADLVQAGTVIAGFLLPKAASAGFVTA